MVAGENVPRNSERPGGVHGLEGFLVEEEEETQQQAAFSSYQPTSDSTDLKPGRLYAGHAFVVEVITQGQNEVGPHLLCYFAHFQSRGLLHSGDVRRVRQTSPVAYNQEPNGGSVSWKTQTQVMKGKTHQETKTPLMLACCNTHLHCPPGLERP